MRVRLVDAPAYTPPYDHALAAARLKIPIWMDYFGDPMAERQMLALRQGSDEGLAAQWELLQAATNVMPPPRLRLAGALSIGLWLAVITCGRMLAFVE